MIFQMLLESNMTHNNNGLFPVFVLRNLQDCHIMLANKIVSVVKPYPLKGLNENKKFSQVGIIHKQIQESSII